MLKVLDTNWSFSNLPSWHIAFPWSPLKRGLHWLLLKKHSLSTMPEALHEDSLGNTHSGLRLLKLFNKSHMCFKSVWKPGPPQKILFPRNPLTCLLSLFLDPHTSELGWLGSTSFSLAMAASKSLLFLYVDIFGSFKVGTLWQYCPPSLFIIFIFSAVGLLAHSQRISEALDYLLMP